MFVQLTKDAVVNTDCITHINGLSGNSTSIHYESGQSQIVELPLSKVVKLLNQARVDYDAHLTSWNVEVWTPVLTQQDS